MLFVVQYHSDAQGIIDPGIRMQDTVFGFMNDRVHRVTNDAKYRGEQGQMPPCGGNCSSLEYDKYRDKLADNDQQVQILWNAVLGLQSRLTCDVRQWRDREIPLFLDG